MSMSYATRQIGDVTVLDLAGRISLTETPFGPVGKVLLHELVQLGELLLRKVRPEAAEPVRLIKNGQRDRDFRVSNLREGDFTAINFTAITVLGAQQRPSMLWPFSVRFTQP